MKKDIKRYLPIALIMVFVLPMMLPASALGLDLSTLASNPLGWLCALIADLILDLMRNMLIPIVKVLFDWGTDFMDIPYVNKIILWLQGLAIVAVVIYRIALGIKDKLLLSGGSNEISLGEYVFKTVWAVVLVAIMPTLCRLVIKFGLMMYTDLGGGALITDQLDWFDIGDDVTGDAIAEAGNLQILWIIIGLLVILILCIACGYQFVRRQLEMLITSIIAPLISIYAASEDNDNEVTDLLKNLFGLVCIQWLQVILVCIAIGFGKAWVTAITASAANGGLMSGYSGVSAQYFMFAIASFMAALTVPKIVDRYTLPSGGSHAGGLVVSNLMRGAMRVPRIRMK